MHPLDQIASGGELSRVMLALKSSVESSSRRKSSAAERTLVFDFLPVDLGTIRGFKTRFHLYTVPGQVYYNASRKLILKGVDGIVFVADSQIERMEANQEAMQNLYDNMAEYGYDLTKMPFVIQYNKRDLPNAAPIRDLQSSLNPGWEVTDPSRMRPAVTRGTARSALSKNLAAISSLLSGRSAQPRLMPSRCRKVRPSAVSTMTSPV